MDLTKTLNMTHIKKNHNTLFFGITPKNVLIVSWKILMEGKAFHQEDVHMCSVVSNSLEPREL